MKTSLSVAEPNAQSPMLELCYRHAYLAKRRSLLQELSPDEETELRKVRGLLEGDLDGPQRRGHRRFPVRLGATLKGPEGSASAVVLNLSADGLFVVTTRPVELGSTVQLRLTTPCGVDYLFTCRVVRCERGSLFTGLGLELCCVPVEMRRRRAA